jgi:hypothetical protein
VIPAAAAQAWAFRAHVEREATARFARLAVEIAAFDPESPVIAMMRKAADDERRHAVLCAELAGGFSEEAGDIRIAPRSLDARPAALYETVAACCITETESVATVASLLAQDADPQVRAILHAIARDEVTHAQMGWAHLAREAASVDVAFLAHWIPSMLSGTAGPELFAPPPADEPDLLRYGVLPLKRKREIFVQTLLDVVFPGLEQFGIDTSPARAWLSERFRACGGAGQP